MTLYAFLTLLHVSGAVLMFVALSIEGVAAGQLRDATAAAPARSWDSLRRRSVWAGVIAIVAVLASGVAMMALRWGPRAWIITGFVGLLVIVTTGLVAALRIRTRWAAAMGCGGQDSSGRTRGRHAQSISRSELRAAGDAVLFSVRVRAATGIAVLGLMTLRPGTLGSITILAAAVALVVVHRLATSADRRSVRAPGAAS